MKDLYFLSGLVVGAGIGMIVAAKNKQVKKIVESSEQSICDCVNEIKQSVTEPLCNCQNNQNSSTSNNSDSGDSKSQTSKSNGKKLNSLSSN